MFFSRSLSLKTLRPSLGQLWRMLRTRRRTKRKKRKLPQHKTGHAWNSG